MATTIPDGFTSITPSLSLKNCAKAIEMYKKAFGAREVTRLDMPDGSGLVMHAVLEIGNAKIMVADAFAGCPDSGNGALFIYVDDADETIAKAEKAGVRVTMKAEDMFWGDRMGNVRDDNGVSWSIATHTRDVSPEEIEAGAKAMMDRMKSKAA